MLLIGALMLRSACMLSASRHCCGFALLILVVGGYGDTIQRSCASR